MKNIKLLVFINLILWVSACKKETSQPIEAIGAEYKVEYAKGFRVARHPDFTEVTVFNPWKPGEVLQNYLLVDKKSTLPRNLPKGILVRTPLTRVVSYSAVHCSVLNELNRLDVITGVCEPEYIKYPAIRDGIKNGNIADLGMAANPNIEKLLVNKPEAILASPIPGMNYGLIEKMGIPIIQCVDYMENSPLGRAEWIRFHSLFYNECEKADSLFHSIQTVYNKMKTVAVSATSHPTVFSEIKYGGTWYVSGGKSYTAQLFKDAGADYCWKDEATPAALSLSFESVLDKAGKADFWLIKFNAPKEMTYESLAANYHPYSYFQAFQKKRIFTCNTGNTPYYDELPVHPEYVLQDMIWIFHPELLPGYTPRYYRPMVN